MAVCSLSGWNGKATLAGFWFFFVFFNGVLCQISITFILWENMRSMCTEFRCAANLTMSLLIKLEVDNYADASNCSWYRVSFSVFIALDLRVHHALLVTEFSAWEVTDGVKRFLFSESISAKAVNSQDWKFFCHKGFLPAKLATFTYRMLSGWPKFMSFYFNSVKYVYG